MKIAQMASLIMLACRLDEKSGNIFARELRNAKLINSGPGRGVNAPDMTNKDLATFLIALLATDKPAKSVELYRNLCSMQLAHPENWATATKKLPNDPDHTFQELMEALCDPEVKAPNQIIIETSGTASVTVTNDGVWNDEYVSPELYYHNRAEMQRHLEAWQDVDLENTDSARVKKIMDTLEDSPISMHGLTTSRRLRTDTIELIKMFMFPEHYIEELRETMEAGE